MTEAAAPGAPVRNEDDTAPLNREAVKVLMAANRIDGVAHLARRAGLERTYLYRILEGKRPAHAVHVHAIAEALKVSPLVILGPGNDPDLDALLAKIDAGREDVA